MILRNWCNQNGTESLLKEWHPTKNGSLTPDNVRHSSKKLIWWICKNGHEWKTAVQCRTRGHNCPICSKRKSVKGNDIQTKKPELAEQWHPTKNGSLKPTEVSCSSFKKVWWVCEKGHEWQATVSNRSHGSNCPYCNSKRAFKGFNDLETLRPEIAKRWHPTKNGDLKPSDVLAWSSKRVWWLCDCGESWEASIAGNRNHMICPTCYQKERGISIQRTFMKKRGSLAKMNPALAVEWHPTKNGALTPADVTVTSVQKAWWLGPCGHEWEAKIDTRNNGRGCPVCTSNKILPGFNDLATKFPEIAKEWHPTLNGDITASDVMPYSNKEFWWLSPCGHEYKAQPHHKCHGQQCPICKKERREVRLSKKKK